MCLVLCIQQNNTPKSPSTCALLLLHIFKRDDPPKKLLSLEVTTNKLGLWTHYTNSLQILGGPVWLSLCGVLHSQLTVGWGSCPKTKTQRPTPSLPTVGAPASSRCESTPHNLFYQHTRAHSHPIATVYLSEFFQHGIIWFLASLEDHKDPTVIIDSLPSVSIMHYPMYTVDIKSICIDLRPWISAVTSSIF